MPVGLLACQAHLVQLHTAGLELMDVPVRKDLKVLLVYLDLQAQLEKKDSEATQGLMGLQGNQGRQN